MKYMVVIAALLCYASLQATIVETDPTKLFKAGETADKSGVVFELKNKAKRPIWIAIANGGGLTASKAMKVDTGETITPGGREINPKLDTQLAVWYSDPSSAVSYEASGFGIVGRKVFKPKPNKFFSFPRNKTLYLTWDESNYARPQTGPLGGMLGKTDTGLSLKNNVEKGEIEEQA